MYGSNDQPRAWFPPRVEYARAHLPAALLVALACVAGPDECRAEEAEKPPAADPPVVATKNVLAAAAGGKVVSATSQLDDDLWKAQNLIDGLLADEKSNGWASNTFQGDAAVDFPQEVVFAVAGDKPRLLARVVIDTKTIDWPLLGRGAKGVEILTAVAGPDGPWTHVARHSLLNQGGPQTVSFKPTEAKFLMLRVTSNWGSDRLVSLGEVEAYEMVMGRGELDELIARLEQILADLRKYRDEIK